MIRANAASGIARTGGRGCYDERDRDDHDPRDGLMHDLDLPRGEERHLVLDRDRVYELNGEDGRTLATVGAFRVVPEHDLDIDHETLGHLRDEGLVDAVDLGDDERGLTLTMDGRDLLDSHLLGVPDPIVRKITGHRSRELERYQHLTPELRALTVNLIATELFRAKRAQNETGTPTGTVRRNRIAKKSGSRQPVDSRRIIGGVDGTRTRGLRRDRPAF